MLYTPRMLSSLLTPTTLALILLSSSTLWAQDSATTERSQPTQFTAKTAYERAMHPLVSTRADISNWSETETTALAITVDIANRECELRDPQALAGSDLVYLGRLCALGRNYRVARIATEKYIAGSGSKPMLGQAYVILIDAELHTEAEPNALTSAKQMLANVPYEASIAQSIDETIDYMRYSATKDALDLASTRQPLILQQLRSSIYVGTESDRSMLATAASQTVHELYAEGMALVELQELINAPLEAAKSVQDLNAALPPSIQTDEAYMVTAIQKRFGLLGKPFPNITKETHIPHSTSHAKSVAKNISPRLLQIPTYGVVTATILFPDWCVQCIRAVAKIPAEPFKVSGHQALMYGLMAETERTRSSPAILRASRVDSNKKNPTASLLDRPIAVVDESVLDLFAAADFPYMILTDSQGIVRVLQPLSADATESGGAIDAAISCIYRYFGSPASSGSVDQR